MQLAAGLGALRRHGGAEICILGFQLRPSDCPYLASWNDVGKRRERSATKARSVDRVLGSGKLV